MNENVLANVLLDAEKAVNGFKIDDWKDRPLFDRFNELYEMVNGYQLPEDQKEYLLRRNIILLAVEAVHDVFPANAFFRENSSERFFVLRAPGQEDKESLFVEWTRIQEENWARQGEIEGEKSTGPGTWWN